MRFYKLIFERRFCVVNRLYLEEKIVLSHEVIILVYLFFRMNSYFSPGIINETMFLIWRFGIVIYTVFVLFIMRHIIVSKLLIITGITELLFIVTGFQNATSITDLLTNIITQNWWAMNFMLYLCAFRKVRVWQWKKIFILGIVAFYVFSARYSIWLLSSSRYWSSGGINSIYFCVFLLPFCYLTNRKIVRFSMMIIAGLLTIISGKRTALIAIILCAFIPIITEKPGKKNRENKGSLLFLILACIILVFMAGYLSESIDITIIQRMQSIQEDGGSGRLTTYNLVWEAVKNSHFFHLVFGHGFNAVFKDHISISSAHNDFLEILYDYGALSLILYLIILGYFVTYAFKLRDRKSKYYQAYISALMMYITLSLVSHLIIYPTYIVFLLFFLGLGVSDSQLNIVINENNKRLFK